MASSAFHLGSSEITWLYKDGDQKTGKTGGWKSVPWSSPTYRGGTATFQEDGVSFYTYGYYCPGISTIHKIDITNIKCIIVIFESNATSTLRAIVSDNGEYASPSIYADSNKKIFVLDVSAISGQKYVQVAVAGANVSETVMLKRVGIVK